MSKWYRRRSANIGCPRPAHRDVNGYWDRRPAVGPAHDRTPAAFPTVTDTSVEAKAVERQEERTNGNVKRHEGERKLHDDGPLLDGSGTERLTSAEGGKAENRF